ncbi:UNVERIFIED_CONTAM: hypothetical protein GTU68_000463 [Idotea baltica]|nr:hypothetical protein [Idotea baltica]
MLTASHNPREYNGYKAYNQEGAQLLAPHDQYVIDEVRKIRKVSDVKWERNNDLVISIGAEIDELFLKEIQDLSIQKEAIKRQHDIGIVYTPLHGVGATMVPEILNRYGFTNVHPVPEQMIPDGNFPTVIFPNPEEEEAMTMALNLGKKINADLIMANDPDADRVVTKLENEKTFICGGEESYGYLIGEHVRDKDAVVSGAILAEMTAYFKDKGSSLFDALLDIYLEHGLYKEKLLAVVKKGKSGAEEISAMMDGFRNSPPSTLGGSAIVEVRDYKSGKAKKLSSNETYQLDTPSSNVLQFVTADGSIVSCRPSGTEPKIKFYCSVQAPLANKADYYNVDAELEKKLNAMISDLAG